MWEFFSSKIGRLNKESSAVFRESWERVDSESYLSHMGRDSLSFTISWGKNWWEEFGRQNDDGEISQWLFFSGSTGLMYIQYFQFMKSLNCCYAYPTFNVTDLAKFYRFSQSVKKLCGDFFFSSLIYSSQNYKIVTTEERFMRNL